MNRQKAIKAGAATYFTGKPCKHGHIAERQTISGTCVTCYKITRKDVQKQYREKNREKIVATYRKRMEQEDIKLQTLQYHRNWSKQNRNKCTFWTASYRQSKLKRTPKWLNAAELFEIECVYSYCAALNAIGLDYHVDHIVPLRGKLVSGLHTPANLQILPAKDNKRKANSFVIE